MRQNTYVPLVSIIIPVYNGANYMREAIDSALAQSYKNIEIIVVNDGSKDNGKTEEIALSYGNKIRYFSKENGGCGSALNYGIKNMQGQYFSWLSHDDIYYPNKIEHQVNILNKLDNKDTIIYGGYELIDENGKSLRYIRPDSVISSKEKLNISLFPLLRGLIHGCSLLIPVKYFHEIGIFDETLPTTQDYDLCFRLFRVAPIYFDDQVLIKARMHPERGTNTISVHEQECEELWSGFLKELTEEEMSKMGDGVIAAFLFDTAAFLKGTPYKKSEKLALEMANEYLNNTKVSVIIPVYNRTNWTIESIESILTQTHQNFEVLIIDDGSTDDVSKLTEICKKDKRIKYFYKENEGPGAARNLGIKKATGEYIAFLDSDDLFMPNKIETQLRFMMENNFVFSHTSYQRIDEEGRHICFINSGKVSGKVFPQIIQTCMITTTTVMGRASLFRQNLFPEGIKIGEDCCMFIAIASKHLIGGIDKALSKFRVRSDGSNAFINPAKYSQGLINIAAYVVNDDYLSKFNTYTINLLVRATAHLRLLENNSTNCGSYSIVQKIRTYCFVTRILILLTITSIRQEGIRATISRIQRWLRKHI